MRLGVPVDDFVATTATGGAAQAHFDTNFVTLVFGDTIDKADNINQIYHRVPLEERRHRGRAPSGQNVVMLWHAHPSDADLARVTACLK